MTSCSPPTILSYLLTPHSHLAGKVFISCCTTLRTRSESLHLQKVFKKISSKLHFMLMSAFYCAQMFRRLSHRKIIYLNRIIKWNKSSEVLIPYHFPADAFQDFKEFICIKILSFPAFQALQIYIYILQINFFGLHIKPLKKSIGANKSDHIIYKWPGKYICISSSSKRKCHHG